MDKEKITKDFYCVPRWCKFPPCYHFDGMGGCWGLSGGHVLEEGEAYCKKCEYHESNKHRTKIDITQGVR